MDHHMRIMNPSRGDDHITWDPDDEASVEAAKKKFDEAIGKGHKAFRVEHQPGEAITEFDPQHKELLLAPAFAGG